MIIITGVDVEEPPVVVPPVVVPEFGFGITLVTSDNTVWDLATGPVYALAGAGGFGAPDVEHWWRQAAAFDGSTHRGLQVPSREVPLPLEVKPTNPADWLDVDRALWKGLPARGQQRLYVVTPDGTARYLGLRRVSGGDDAIDIDPSIFGQSIYEGLTFHAGDPYWLGPRVVVTFEDVSPVNFFPGPPFTINPTNTVQTAQVTNPGDVEAWPRWEIEGPFTEATVGVGGAVTTITASVGAGQTRIVDLNPARRSVKDGNGDDAWLDLTERNFASIPPGENVQLDLDITGSGTGTRIELAFDPRYERAW